MLMGSRPLSEAGAEYGVELREFSGFLSRSQMDWPGGQKSASFVPRAYMVHGKPNSSKMNTTLPYLWFL